MQPAKRINPAIRPAVLRAFLVVFLQAVLITLLQTSIGLGQDPDTALVQDAIYERPFIFSQRETSIGGYVEGNTNYFVEDGVSEGFSMELRRFNIFLFSSISPRVRLLSELEFEHGTEEIKLETALVDFQVNTGLVLRGGVLLVPIGAFNQNHDAPLWEFVERPLVSTQVIPSTLSEIGFGANGKFFLRPLTLTYDLYLTNGLGDGIVLNGEGRTHLASGRHEELLAEDNNGSPALSGRLAAQHRSLGEIGLSYYGGIYNSFRAEGEEVDEKRRFAIVAVDFDTEFRSVAVRGEVAFSAVDVPAEVEDLFADRQWGMYVDVIVPVWRFSFSGYEDAVLNLSGRFDRVDLNVGTFESTGGSRFDETNVLTLGIGFRPSADTVFRFNFRNEWFRDVLGNPTVRTAGYQFGVATYF